MWHKGLADYIVPVLVPEKGTVLEGTVPVLVPEKGTIQRVGSEVSLSRLAEILSNVLEIQPAVITTFALSDLMALSDGLS